MGWLCGAPWVYDRSFSLIHFKEKWLKVPEQHRNKNRRVPLRHTSWRLEGKKQMSGILGPSLLEGVGKIKAQ